MIAVDEKLSPITDEVGNRYGKLTVAEYAGQNERNKRIWLCRCDCGEEKVIAENSLRTGNSKSCGCTKILPPGEAAFNALFHNFRRSAEKRDHDFELTDRQVRDLVTQKCHYCGIVPAQVMKAQHGNGDFLYNGIDRVDNSIGYVEGNVVPCCGVCNNAKHTMGTDEFKAWLTRIYKYFILEFK